MSQQYVFLVKKNSKLRKLQKTQYYFLLVNELWSDAGALIQCPLLGNGEGNLFEYTRAAQQCIPHGSKWEQKANSHLNGMFAVRYITTKNVRRVLPCKITSKFTSKAGELVTARQVYSIRKKPQDGYFTNNCILQYLYRKKNQLLSLLWGVTRGGSRSGWLSRRSQMRCGWC